MDTEKRAWKTRKLESKSQMKTPQKSSEKKKRKRGRRNVTEAEKKSALRGREGASGLRRPAREEPNRAHGNQEHVVAGGQSRRAFGGVEGADGTSERSEREGQEEMKKLRHRQRGSERGCGCGRCCSGRVVGCR